MCLYVRVDVCSDSEARFEDHLLIMFVKSQVKITDHVCVIKDLCV